VTRWRVPQADLVLSDDEIAAVADTYRSGWIAMGPKTEQFERAFADYTGARHALAVGSGTAALHLICAAAGLGPGDEVIVPSLTFVATVNAIAYTGATPVFADIASLERPWLSPESVAAVVSDRTRAVMTVAYGGHPGALAELEAFARERGLLLLEDAAHAPGAWLADGRHVGTAGLAGAFSFYSNKNLPVGEGGMVVTDDDALAAQVRLLRSHGMTTLTWQRHEGHASSYDVVERGFNYRIDDPRAALGVKRLEVLEEHNEQRRRLDAAYRRELDAVPGVSPALPPPAEGRSACHLFTVVLDEAIDRDAVRAELHARGVQTSVHYPPAHSFAIYRDAAAGAALPNTEEYARRALTLPLFPHMSDEQLGIVVEELRAACPTRTSRAQSA